MLATSVAADTEPPSPESGLLTEAAAASLEAPPTDKQGHDHASRDLGGHRFNPTELLRDPFATTHFGIELLGGIGQYRAFEIDSNGSFTNTPQTYQAGLLIQRLGMQARVYKGLTIDGQLSGQAFTGADKDAALLFGANGGYSFAGGAKYGYTFGKMRVSGALDVAHDRNYGFNIRDAIVNSINAGTVSIDTLINRTNETSVGGSAQFAIGFGEAFGAYTDVAFNRQTEASVNQLSAALAASAKIPGMPISFLGSYKFSQVLTDGANPFHEYGFGVYYAGRHNLALGVEFQGFYTDYGNDVSLLGLGGLFRMRYFWTDGEK